MIFVLYIDGLFLHELCSENNQCTGTENANTCTRYEKESQSSCKCNDEYIEINSSCYKGKISICVNYLYIKFKKKC